MWHGTWRPSALHADLWITRRGASDFVDFLFIVTPIVGVCNCSMFCCTLLYVHFSIAIILMGKRELIALLNLSSWCLVMVEQLFLTVPRGCLQFVIVVFPDHTHLLFFISNTNHFSSWKSLMGSILQYGHGPAVTWYYKTERDQRTD